MSEEEQEAIKELENIKKIGNDTGFAYGRKSTIILQKAIETVLNLIDKLQKENEELKEEVLNWKGQYHLLSRKIDCISKDKIRNKIKELEEELDKEMKEVKDFTDFNPMIPVLMTERDTLSNLLGEEDEKL